MSNLLWAYATLGWAPAHLLTSLALETLRQLPFFKPQVCPELTLSLSCLLNHVVQPADCPNACMVPGCHVYLHVVMTHICMAAYRHVP